MRKNVIEIQTQVYFLLPILILLIPNQWVWAWILAAAIHEGYHILALSLLHVRIVKLKIGILGAKIETEPMHKNKELFVALAGPIGALLTLLLWKFLPRVGLCAIIQTAYNLLPIYPLDGGRAVRCMLSTWFKNEYLCFIEKGILTIFIIGCLFISLYWKLGILPVVLALCLWKKYTNANIPCKDCFHRVQ